ncbi:helicase-related protein [Cellulomonas cellasea]|uniref:NgoFVII family restriction endonuclease n=1 Tax=Cellulomonas cellasea TaxID=43670 RepID=A0A7W4UJZ7_9CELL|nr:helicase-related protein [Cellulomonas cellasea]MBB2925551.1 hypothetical protein [Cellulomonas cellasea]
MTRIYDNITRRLGDDLVTYLGQFERMDVAVGYFNLRGWSVFNDLVASKASEPAARILIGMVTPTEQAQTLDELQASLDGRPAAEADSRLARQRRDQLLDHLREQLMRGAPTARDRATLSALREQLATGRVQIKVFTRRPLHGKTYLLHRQDPATPILGFVGSSNLTAPGLTSNYELNVDVVDDAAARDLAQWFHDRWEDPFSRPVTDELLAVLEESWAAPTPRRPYEVFLKVCYDLSRDVREGLAEYSVPPEVHRQLLDFQATAVKTLARRLMTRGGTMLGDVVGLGKTLTAVAVSLMLRDEHGYQPLVLCPKNLERMWIEHMEAYGLHGRVVPYSQAHTILPTLRRYPLAIIDESHTLRNEERRDYSVLREYLRANDSKVLLLTATPFNIRFTDVANQLALYLDEDTDLGLSPVNALAADPKLVDKVDQKVTTLAAFRHSEEPEDWKRLMGEHLVRRTRTFIRSSYAKTGPDGREYLEVPDGRRFTFPDRIAVPLAHEFLPGDPAALMADDVTLDTIRGLRLPRYDLGSFLEPHAVLSPVEEEFAERVARGRGQVAGFVRTMFYKRLSSCGWSFLVSVRRHVARNEVFLYALQQGMPVPTGTIADADLGDGDPDSEANVEGLGEPAADRYAALVEADPRGLTWVRAELFTDALREALEQDTDALRALVDSYGAWDAGADSKLAELTKLLTTTHAGDKVLIFTEYKDTADYVHGQLRAAGIADVGLATGATDDPTGVARRFSPRSNALPGTEGVGRDDELRVLLASDVLSEGQNLQDSSVVVNYDLPWAIIRLIQRAGRVDRLTQEADTVTIYSFFHESVEKVISLRQRIATRLTANAAAFGSDERFFGTDDEVAQLHDLYSGTLPGMEDATDVDAASLAYQYWKAATDEDAVLADRIASLPDLVDATRTKRITDPAQAVVAYVRTQSDQDGFAVLEDGGHARLLTGQEALRWFEASPHEPGLPLVHGHDDAVLAMVRGPLSAPRGVAGRLRGVRARIWKRLGGTLFEHDTDTSAALEALFQYPLSDDAERRLKRSIRNGLSDEDLLVRLSALHRAGSLVVATRHGDDPVRIVSSMGVTL